MVFWHISEDLKLWALWLRGQGFISDDICYCTISIYSVDTCHRRAYRNRNVVNVTHHRGLYRKHNWSWLLVWAKFGAKKRLFALLTVNFTSPAHYSVRSTLTASLVSLPL